eukprot:EG_transcript_28957
MVKLDVCIKADLENITDLSLPGDTRWYFNVVLEGEEGDEKEIYLVPREELEIPNSKGTCCFTIKSKFSKNQGTITFLKTDSYNEEDSGKMKAIGTFDCRGCELTKFFPRSGFEASSTKSSAKYKDIDLSEGDWAEYDERANESVMISSVETEICRAKEKKK